MEEVFGVIRQLYPTWFRKNGISDEPRISEA